jgi:glycosyltransferase involved in cell wall biosynthesis
MKFSKIAPIGVNFHGMNMFLPTSGSKLKFSNIIFKYIVKKNMISSDFVFSYGANVSLTILNAGVDSNKIIEIPTGIEKEWIISEDIISVNKKLRFLFIGRNDPLKGINNIFKAISNIKSDLFEFVFIGPIDEKLINNNIKYYGLIKDIERIKNIIDSCDVLVSPSFSEGMPNVRLEAMSRGLIILATNVGANSLLVSNSNGLIIKSPAPENILNSIEYILDQESENLKKMKLNSIKKIKTSFTWDVIAQNSKDEILNILSK